MSDPLVCCVLLTADRPAMTARAVRSFLSQTYERKALLVFDSGRNTLEHESPFCLELGMVNEAIYTRAEQFRGATIGALRNAANELCRGAEIIAHFDSDDWSHPYRLAEQVNLLQASRADAVGYHDMLMWRAPMTGAPGTIGDAHLYRYDGPRAVSTYALETSLLYWRRSWERMKFTDSNLGDRDWVRQVRCVSDNPLPLVDAREIGNRERTDPSCVQLYGYRMIAEIHGSNTVMRPDLLGSHNFTRVPEWDAYCRERMAL